MDIALVVHRSRLQFVLSTKIHQERQFPFRPGHHRAIFPRSIPDVWPQIQSPHGDAFVVRLGPFHQRSDGQPSGPVYRAFRIHRLLRPHEHVAKNQERAVDDVRSAGEEVVLSAGSAAISRTVL